MSRGSGGTLTLLSHRRLLHGAGLRSQSRAQGQLCLAFLCPVHVHGIPVRRRPWGLGPGWAAVGAGRPQVPRGPSAGCRVGAGLSTSRPGPLPFAGPHGAPAFQEPSLGICSVHL